MNRRKGIIGFLAFAAASLGLGQKKDDQLYGGQLDLRPWARDVVIYKKDILDAFEPPKPGESKP